MSYRKGSKSYDSMSSSLAFRVDEELCPPTDELPDDPMIYLRQGMYVYSKRFQKIMFYQSFIFRWIAQHIDLEAPVEIPQKPVNCAESKTVCIVYLVKI